MHEKQTLIGVSLTPQQATQVVAALEILAARDAQWAEDLYEERGCTTTMVRFYVDEAFALRELAQQIFALHILAIQE